MSRLRDLASSLFSRFLPSAPAAQLAAPTAQEMQRQPLYRQVGTYRLLDWMAGIPDPDEVLRRTGRTRAQLRELMRHHEVSQALDTRREAVLATPFRFEGEETEQTKWLKAQVEPHVCHILRQAWDALPYGYSVQEVVYRRDGGRIGLDCVHAPPFEWFRPMPDGGLRFFPETGEGGATGIECDPRKFILTRRNATYRQPFGESILAPLYWPVTWSLQGWVLWLDFLDTFGAPIVVGKTPQYEQFVAAMQAQGVRRTVAWQASSADETLQTITASAPGEFERLENALERVIQRAILGQTLTSDVGQNGSFAAAKVHNEVRDDKRRADLRMVGEALQQVIDNLWELNGFPGESPEACLQDDVGLEHYERLVAIDAQLVEKVGIRFTPEAIGERYGLEPETDFTMPEPVAAPAAGAVPGAAAPSSPDAAAQDANLSAGTPKVTASQAVIEREVERYLGAGQLAPIELEDLRTAIRGAKDESDLRDRLAALYDRDDNGFADLLAKASFAANVLGYIHAKEEA